MGWVDGGVCVTHLVVTPGYLRTLRRMPFFTWVHPKKGGRRWQKAFASSADNVWCTLTGSESTYLQTQQHYYNNWHYSGAGDDSSTVSSPRLSQGGWDGRLTLALLWQWEFSRKMEFTPAKDKHNVFHLLVVVTFGALLENGNNTIICTTKDLENPFLQKNLTCCGSFFLFHLVVGTLSVVGGSIVAPSVMILTSCSTLLFPADFKGYPSFHPKADN